MSITKTQTPYEFLARWDATGKLAGAHVGFLERITDGAEVLSERALPVQPVGGDHGFPLADILSQLQADALTSAEAARAERDAAQAAKATAESERDAAQAAKAAAESERDAALAELAALKVTPADTGVPQSVSRFQARAALYQAGLLAQIEAYMASEQADPIARLAWQDAQEFRRTSPTVAALAALLGLDDAALDALFTAAAQIQA